jgi:hypothetical protein
MSTEKHAALAARLSPSGEGIRVLVLTNEHADGDHPGHRDAFARLEHDGSIEHFAWAAPNMLARSKGYEWALRELLEIIATKRANVVVQFPIQGFPFTDEWFRAVAATPTRPLLLYIEQDAWGRLGKPVRPETRRWWAAADVVFTVAVGEQRRLIERYGGRDVRHIPNTYDHVVFAAEEEHAPETQGEFHEVAVIGNCWGRRYLSRLPGARQRIQLVRALQRDRTIPLAIYGRNWAGRGVRGAIDRNDQAAVARRALLTANWDHFPTYAAYSSNRLTVQLLAGRAQVTTLHPSMEWLPGPQHGLFLEASVENALLRVRALLEQPREEVLELGLEAHRWARHRLSDRELARYVLGAVDPRLTRTLPDEPWGRLPE